MSTAHSPQDLEIIGALSPGRAASLAAIQAVLAAEARSLHHGDTFTGRPGTRILAGPEGVVKWSLGRPGTLEAARDFCRECLERERRLGVHHPAKTWFLWRRDNGVWICNHTPRLLALHVGLTELRGDQRLPALGEVLNLYARAAASGLRLDEGLSNFGLAGDGRVYYLDDDLYPWDEFVGLGAGLGVWLRQLAWLEGEGARRLGLALREALRVCGDEAPVLLARELRGMICLGESQSSRRAGLLTGLAGETAPASTPAPRPASAPTTGQLAVLADIHANWPALRAVLAELERRGVAAGIVLGDIVGYGPHPRACIEALRGRGFRVIKGNHDNALARGIPQQGFSRQARWALEWSAPHLDEADRRWLDDLPLYLQEPDFMAVHGAPQDRSYFNAYVYRMTYEDNLDYLAEHDIRVCFHGHTHVQGYYYQRGEEQGFGTAPVLDLDTVAHCLVCPGSVGQPRGKRPGAEFALLDRGRRQVSFHRVEYDLECTIRDMAGAGFPEALMARLRVGQ